MQAHSIFERRGMIKNLRETKQKLKLLQQINKKAALDIIQFQIVDHLDRQERSTSEDVPNVDRRSD